MEKTYISKFNEDYAEDIFLKEMLNILKIRMICMINLYDKNNYVVHIRSLTQALNHGLILRKVNRLIQFKQEAWLKEYIDMNTESRKEAKNDFVKDFLKLMNNSAFGKTVENVRKHRDNRRNRLV